MNYDSIASEDEVNAAVTAAGQGKLRPATKRESMAVRLAALSGIVHELQDIVKNDMETKLNYLLDTPIWSMAFRRKRQKTVDKFQE
jgi:hypothetical protein